MVATCNATGKTREEDCLTGNDPWSHSRGGCQSLLHFTSMSMVGGLTSMTLFLRLFWASRSSFFSSSFSFLFSMNRTALCRVHHSVGPLGHELSRATTLQSSWMPNTRVFSLVRPSQYFFFAPRPRSAVPLSSWLEGHHLFR